MPESRPRALLPPAEDLAQLSLQKIDLVFKAVEAEGKRNLKYDLIANQRSQRNELIRQVCGTVSLIAAMGFFTYLVMNHHDWAASVVVGTTVTGAIVRMSRSK